MGLIRYIYQKGFFLCLSSLNYPPPPRKNNLKSIAYSKSGRSMIEMLGVLAIIGVLSIGAIVGFRYAMDKDKANKIMNDVSLVYAAVETSERTYSDWADIRISSESGLDFKVFKGISTYVKAVGITGNVCNQLLKMKTDKLTFYTDFPNSDIMVELETCADEQNIVFALDGQSTPEPTCNTGVKVTVGNHTYCKGNTATNWDGAKEFCAQNNRPLVDVYTLCSEIRPKQCDPNGGTNYTSDLCVMQPANTSTKHVWTSTPGTSSGRFTTVNLKNHCIVWSRTRDAKGENGSYFIYPFCY